MSWIVPFKKLKDSFTFNTSLEEQKKIIAALKSERDARISRWDYVDARVDSLILLHPEAKDQQPMIDFIARVTKYKKEHPTLERLE